MKSFGGLKDLDDAVKDVVKDGVKDSADLVHDSKEPINAVNNADKAVKDAVKGPTEESVHESKEANNNAVKDPVYAIMKGDEEFKDMFVTPTLQVDAEQVLAPFTDNSGINMDTNGSDVQMEDDVTHVDA